MTASVSDFRARLNSSRLLLVFTPALVESKRGSGSALEIFEACMSEVDIVQVRVKQAGERSGPSPARELFDWTRRVLDLCRARESIAPLITVNDRVDVALALASDGCAGCHIGRGDLPPTEARALLGPQLLLGLSTGTPVEVALAPESEVDYLGFGPIYPTATKGYDRGLGPEAAWVAREGSSLPVFPIGGIDETNASELKTSGRLAVGSAILDAADPARAARSLRNQI